MPIVDAGPLYASAARRDKHHERSVELLSAAPGPLLVPALVISEVSCLLGDRLGPHAEVAFARSLANAELVAEPVLDSDWGRVAELMDQYVHLPLWTVDASVVALAERRGLEVIATLDQRHFRAVRPKHVAPSSPELCDAKRRSRRAGDEAIPCDCSTPEMGHRSVMAPLRRHRQLAACLGVVAQALPDSDSAA